MRERKVEDDDEAAVKLETEKQKEAEATTEAPKEQSDKEELNPK